MSNSWLKHMDEWPNKNTFLLQKGQGAGSYCLHGSDSRPSPSYQDLPNEPQSDWPSRRLSSFIRILHVRPSYLYVLFMLPVGIRSLHIPTPRKKLAMHSKKNVAFVTAGAHTWEKGACWSNIEMGRQEFMQNRSLLQKIWLAILTLPLCMMHECKEASVQAEYVKQPNGLQSMRVWMHEFACIDASRNQSMDRSIFNVKWAMGPIEK